VNLLVASDAITSQVLTLLEKLIEKLPIAITGAAYSMPILKKFDGFKERKKGYRPWWESRPAAQMVAASDDVIYP
jgi:hypothetical protein